MKDAQAPGDGFTYLTDEMQDVLKKNTVGNSKIAPMCYRVYNSEDSGGGKFCETSHTCGAFLKPASAGQIFETRLLRVRNCHQTFTTVDTKEPLVGDCLHPAVEKYLDLTFIQHVAAALTSQLNVCQPGRLSERQLMLY